MTVICAVSDGRNCVIGSDLIADNDGALMNCAPKWIERGSWALGIAGWSRAVDVLREGFDRVAPHLGAPVSASVYGAAKAMAELLDADRFNYDSEPGPKGCGCSFILAHPQSIWHIDCGFGFERIGDWDLWAEGSGRDFALGAASTVDVDLENPNRSLYRKVELAIVAANRYSPTCQGVWTQRLGGVNAREASEARKQVADSGARWADRAREVEKRKAG